MKASQLVRVAAIALAASVIGTAAQAQGDIYSRLMQMHEMDRNKDGMISKQEFMAMIAKMWDNYVTEKKISGNKIREVDLKELEKILGRSVGAGG
jgi:hypothetical protein